MEKNKNGLEFCVCSLTHVCMHKGIEIFTSVKAVLPSISCSFSSVSSCCSWWQ